MRASQRNRRGDDAPDRHVSGCESLCERSDIERLSQRYVSRALSHARGCPDEIIVTIEKLKERPVRRPLLPPHTLSCSAPPEAKHLIGRILSEMGVSAAAAKSAFSLLASPGTMRGASLILCESGRRAEPDRQRGVRVSRLAIESSSLHPFSKGLTKAGINTDTVREALALASKVAGHRAVVGEICISDDPDYTTGYFASRRLGYLRVPHIKQSGDMRGGRVFFVKEDADVDALIAYLEKTPVLLYMP